jgi:galactokinase
VTGWAAYVAGVIWALRRAGHRVTGGNMSIGSDVETGSGLASSAALECAVVGAIAVATGLCIDKVEQARIAQRAENDYVGAPTGLMDQLAVLFAEPLRTLLIDFREITVRPVTFDPGAANVALLLINSRARPGVLPVSARPPTYVCRRCARCRITGCRCSTRWPTP